MYSSLSIRYQFDVEITRGKFFEISSILNPSGNYYINLTWKFQRGFDFQNRQNIDEFSTWNFLCRFDVKST